MFLHARLYEDKGQKIKCQRFNGQRLKGATKTEKFFQNFKAVSICWLSWL